jgi:hypothetical protein
VQVEDAVVDEPAANRGAEREAQRRADAKKGDRQPDPALRSDPAKGGEHHARVAELEPDQQQTESRLPTVLGEPQDSEDHHLDESAAGDDRDAAVTLRPHAPEGDQRQAKEEERGVEVAGPGRHLGRRDLHGGEVKRHEAENVRNGEGLDGRSDPEQHQQGDPA